MEELFSFLIFLVIGLIVIGFLVIKTSGWDKLAKKYAYRKKFKGRLFRVITAYVGMVTYRKYYRRGCKYSWSLSKSIPIFPGWLSSSVNSLE